MKSIQQVNVWVNGQQKNADKLNVISSFDDLSSTATLTYTIGIETSNPITTFTAYAGGIVTLEGKDYTDWDGTTDWAYQFVATKLNLTILN